jgi:hypothetical protein
MLLPRLIHSNSNRLDNTRDIIDPDHRPSSYSSYRAATPLHLEFVPLTGFCADEVCLVHANFVQAKMRCEIHIMRSGGGARPLGACYKVQAVAEFCLNPQNSSDARHKLIVEFDVSTCPDDKGILRGCSVLGSRKLLSRENSLPGFS